MSRARTGTEPKGTGVTGALELLKSGTMTPRELFWQLQERIGQGESGAWTCLLPYQAPEAGPLHGVPVAIKDNIDIAGSVSRAGSAAMNDRAPAEADAACVVALKKAGALVLGRTAMTDLVFTALGTHSKGTPVNQLDPRRVPGGSSSGSAVAVAAGEACAALGTDTGGSIRIPAAFNGLVGLKPTTGSLDMGGIVPLSKTLDTVGPIARTVRDAAIIHGVLSGTEPGTPASGMRVLLPDGALLHDLEEPVADAFADALRLLVDIGASVVRQSLPVIGTIRAAASHGSFAGFEAWRDHGHLISQHAMQMEPYVARHLLSYAGQDPGGLELLERARVRAEKEFLSQFDGFDLLVLPTVMCLPPLLAESRDASLEGELENRVLRNTQPLNFLGLPALSVPCATHGPGRMVGVTIAGRAGSEWQLLRVGEAFEAARDESAAA